MNLFKLSWARKLPQPKCYDPNLRLMTREASQTSVSRHGYIIISVAKCKGMNSKDSQSDNHVGN